MFTFRFMNNDDETVVSGARYDKKHLCESIKSKPDKTIACMVSIYQTITSDSQGVEFHVGEHHRGYERAYVENAAGKTIDRIGPFK